MVRDGFEMTVMLMDLKSSDSIRCERGEAAKGSHAHCFHRNSCPCTTVYIQNSRPDVAALSDGHVIRAISQWS